MLKHDLKNDVLDSISQIKTLVIRDNRIRLGKMLCRNVCTTKKKVSIYNTKQNNNEKSS